MTTQTQIGELTLDGQRYILAPDRQGYLFRTEKAPAFAPVATRTTYGGLEAFQQYRALSINDLSGGLGLSRIPSEEHREAAPYRRFWQSDRVDTRWANSIVLAPEKRRESMPDLSETGGKLVNLKGVLHVLYVESSRFSRVRELSTNRVWGREDTEATIPVNYAFGPPAVASDGQYIYTARFASTTSARKIIFHRRDPGEDLTDTVNFTAANFNAGQDTVAARPHLVNNGGVVFAIYGGTGGNILIAKSSDATFDTQNMPTIGDDATQIHQVVSMTGTDGRPKVYVATHTALYEVDPDERTVEVIEVAAPSEHNFKFLTLHQGSLYYPVNVPTDAAFVVKKLTNRSGAHFIEDVSVPDDSLPSDVAQSPVTGMASILDILYVTVGADCVYALMPNGSWHCVGKLDVILADRYVPEPTRDIEVGIEPTFDGGHSPARDFEIDSQIPAQFASGARDASKDFSTLVPAHFSGLYFQSYNTPNLSTTNYAAFTDGSQRFWVVDNAPTPAVARCWRWRTGKDYVRDAGRDFTLDSAITAVYGAFSANGRAWIIDRGSTIKAYCYLLSNRSRRASEDIVMTSANGSPSGGFANSTYAWVADDTDHKMYCYRLSTRAYDSSRDITLDVANGSPVDGFSDGTTGWLVDSSARKAFAYTLSTRARDTSKDFVLTSDNSSPYGATYVRRDAFIVDNSQNVNDQTPIFQYEVNHAARPISFEQASFNNATHAWIVDELEHRFYAFHITDGASWSFGDLDPTKSFFVPALANSQLRAAVAYEDTAWVFNRATQGPVFVQTFDLGTGARISSNAFDVDPDNNPPQISSRPVAAFTDGVTLWVVDEGSSDSQLSWVRAYWLSGGARDTTKDFSLSTVNDNPWGAWYANETAFIVDQADRRVYAYDLRSGFRFGTRQNGVGDSENREFVLNSANSFATDAFISRDGQTAWVVDDQDNKCYAYSIYPQTNRRFTGAFNHGNSWLVDSTGREVVGFDMSSRSYLSSLRFDLNAQTTLPTAMFGDSVGAYLWVISDDKRAAHAYRRNSGSQYGDRVTSKDFTLQGTTRGSSSNPNYTAAFTSGETSYVLDRSQRKFHAYNNALARPAYIAGGASDLDLHADNADPQSALTDHEYVWVLDGADRKAYAYNLESGDRTPSNDFDLATGNTDAMAAFFYSRTGWIIDDTDGKAYTYRLFDTGVNMTGAFSNGRIFWFADTTDHKAYAYSVATGQREADEDFDFVSSHTLQGVIADDERLWIVSFVGATGKAYQYDLTASPPFYSGAYDFDLVDQNRHPIGGATDGVTAWVVDATDDYCYAYTLDSNAADTDKGFRINHEGSPNPVGGFTDGVTMWVLEFGEVGQGHRAFAYTLSTGAYNSRLDFSLSEHHDDPTGAVDAVEEGGIVWVVDRLDSKAYAYTRPRGADVLSLEAVGSDLIIPHSQGTMSYFPFIGARALPGTARESEGTVDLPFMDIGLPGFQKAWYYVRVVAGGDFDDVANVVRVEYDDGGGWSELGIATRSFPTLLFVGGGYVADRVRFRLRLSRGVRNDQTPEVLNVIIAVLPEIPTYTYQFTVDVTKTSIESGVHAPSLLKKLRKAADSVSRVPMKYGGQDTVLVDVAAIRNRLRQEVPDAMLADWGEDSGLVEVVAHERV